MTESPGTEGRRQWIKPRLRRIEAGSAEASAKTGTADGGTNINGKNFS
jgi:hypothetical protein